MSKESHEQVAMLEIAKDVLRKLDDDDLFVAWDSTVKLLQSQLGESGFRALAQQLFDWAQACDMEILCEILTGEYPEVGQGEKSEGTEDETEGITPDDIKNKNIDVIVPWLKKELERHVDSAYGAGYKLEDDLADILRKIMTLAGRPFNKKRVGSLITHQENRVKPSYALSHPDTYHPDDDAVDGYVNFMDEKIITYSCNGDGWGFGIAWEDTALATAVEKFLESIE